MIPHPRPRLLGRRLLRQPSGRNRSGLRLLRKRGLLQNLRSRNRKNSRHLKRRKRRNKRSLRRHRRLNSASVVELFRANKIGVMRRITPIKTIYPEGRSEERRVGKEG